MSLFKKSAPAPSSNDEAAHLAPGICGLCGSRGELFDGICQECLAIERKAKEPPAIEGAPHQEPLVSHLNPRVNEADKPKYDGICEKIAKLESRLAGLKALKVLLEQGHKASELLAAFEEDSDGKA